MPKKKVSKTNTPKEFEILGEWLKENKDATPEDAQGNFSTWDFDGRVFAAAQRDFLGKKNKPKKTTVASSNNTTHDAAIYALRMGTIAKAISAVEKIGSDPTLDFVSGCGGVEKAVEVLNTLEAEMNF